MVHRMGLLVVPRVVRVVRRVVRRVRDLLVVVVLDWEWEDLEVTGQTDLSV